MGDLLWDLLSHAMGSAASERNDVARYRHDVAVRPAALNRFEGRPISGVPGHRHDHRTIAEVQVRVRNRKAKVWTIPSSDLVETDSAGFWSIDIGLIPGEYKVLAEVDGTKGQVAKVPAELGKSTTVHVVLGAEDNAWPPSVAFDRLLPAPTKGPGAVRGSCCE